MPPKPTDRQNLIHSLVQKLKELASELGVTPTKIQFCEVAGASDYSIRIAGGYEELMKMADLQPPARGRKKSPSADGHSMNILIFDIELAPMELYGWALFDQNFGLNQIKKDWYVLSWAAKWLGSPEEEVMYADQRNEPDISNDYGIISQIWQLLDEADIVITQNGIKFDAKKLNARFILNGFPEPSSYRHIDTLRIAKKKFAFTSNKLEYMTDKLCTKYKKLKHNDFVGFELWAECLKNNPLAWTSMEKYNRYDVLSTEELYLILRPWDKTINFNVYHDGGYQCSCGSIDLIWSGYDYSNSSKKERYTCNQCGQGHTAKENLLSKEKRQSLMK